MASSKTASHERALMEKLRHAVHGLHAPFACGGTLVPEQPVTIRFPDKTRIPVLRVQNVFEQKQLLQPLVERCAAAPFGMGRKTRYDRTVRDALQIKAEGGAFSVLHFDPAAAGILEQIRRELTPQVPDAPTAELYNLNVYATGGHFAPHKDTPRGSVTGYFGNEGSDIDLYVYGALHVAIPPYGEGTRAVTRAEPSRVSSPVPRKTKRR